MSYSIKVCPKCGSQKINWRWLCLNCAWEPTVEDTHEEWGIEVFVGTPEKGEFKLKRTANIWTAPMRRMRSRSISISRYTQT